MSDEKPRVLGKGEYTRMYQKIYDFIKKVFNKTQDDLTVLDNKITDISTDTTESKKNFQEKIDNINKEINESKTSIESNTKSISDLKNQLDNTNLECDGHPEGEIVNINNIDQYLFNDVAANEVIEIPNEDGTDNFIIQCYEQIEGQDDIEVRVFNFTEENKEDFVYDERYLDLSDEGIKPKTEITLNYNLMESGVDEEGKDYQIYVSDEIPQELFDNINQINTIEES